MRVHVPPQHGAWAFLLVPLVLAALLGAATWVGLLFAITWVIAYPATYFGSRAVMTRARRGTWSRIARRELQDALPWLIALAVTGVALVAMRPWVVIPGAVVGVVWLGTAWLTWIGRERGIVNDLLLVVLSAVAAPLMWAVAVDQPAVADIPSALWLAMGVCIAFFTGSVLHVKSLIREADDRRWHLASIVYHAIVLVIVPFVSWWLVPAFGFALVRTVVMRPGLRPGRIGAVEAVLSLLVIAGTVLAVH